MSLASKLEQDYLIAYKAKDNVRVGVLRLLKTALKNFQVEHLHPPTDDDVLDIITRQCKQREDSITQFTDAGRKELADKEAAERDILVAYMPPRLEGEELTAAIAQAIAEVNASSVKDMGRVMQAVMAANKGRVDGKVASEAVKSALQKL